MSFIGSARIAFAAFLAGMALMLVFDATLTRIAGVALILAGMALGVFAIASDEFVAGDAEETELSTTLPAHRSPNVRS